MVKAHGQPVLFCSISSFTKLYPAANVNPGMASMLAGQHSMDAFRRAMMWASCT